MVEAEILQAILTSAAVAGSISALANYFLSGREARKQRQGNFLTQKLGAYSTFIFHLEKMRYKGQAIDELKGSNDESDKFLFTREELEEAVDAIDRELKDKYYLFSPDILREWVHVKTLMYNPLSTSHINNLRKLLVDEYNGKIIPSYEKVVDKIQRAEEPKPLEPNSKGKAPD